MTESRTFRVFVSSTFGDLKAERTALQERVWPRLQAQCAALGARFQAIDLRWGISEEAALDHRTIPICLDEIARCQKVTPRPNFIVILGDRFGWKPVPWTIPAADFDAIQQAVVEDFEAGDRCRGLLKEWYRLEENVDPPAWELRPRSGPLLDPACWEAKEREILHALVYLASAAEISPATERIIGASATEIEILQGVLENADSPEHVFGFFRTIDGLPTDTSAGDYRDLLPDGHPDSVAARRLDQLKAELRLRLGQNVSDFKTRWNVSGPEPTHLETFCEGVFERLWSTIREQLEQSATIDSLDAEICSHQAFCEERAHRFLGRTTSLAFVQAGLAHESPHPIVITGAPGSGKSAFLGQASEDWARSRPAGTMIRRFIGATPASTGLTDLLQGICRELDRAAGVETGAFADNFQGLVAEFHQRVERAASTRPVAIFLDALDQLSLSDRARGIGWLPIRLPANLRMVVSTLPGPLLQALRRRVPPDRIHALPSMPAEEADMLLSRWLEASGRRLGEQQRRLILKQYEGCGLPLYLKLAFEESRCWSSRDPAESRQLAPTLEGLITQFLERLESPAAHGAAIVGRALGYLVAGRNGLTEEELIDLLSQDATVMDDFRRRSPRSPRTGRLPFVVWSRLRHDLGSYLSERDSDRTTVLSFFHRQFHDVVARRYAGGEHSVGRHSTLADYFGAQPDSFVMGGRDSPNRRKVSELVHHLVASGRGEDLFRTITNFGFLMTKCSAGLSADTVRDYERARTVLPPERHAVADVWRTFFQQYSHLLGRGEATGTSDRILLQLASEHADDSPVTRAAEQWLESSGFNGWWLRRAVRPAALPTSRTLRVFEGTGAPVLGALRLSDGRVVSWSHDGSFAFWDLDDPLPQLQVQAVDLPLSRIVEMPGGRLLSQAAEALDISCWDSVTGDLVSSLEGHEAPVSVILPLSERQVATGSDDGILRLWDVVDGRCTRIFKGHDGPVTVVTVLGEGRFLSGGKDGFVRLWRLDQDAEAGTFGPMGKEILGVLPIDPEGFLSWTTNGIRRWDLQSGRMRYSIDAYSYSVCLSQPGRIVGGYGPCIWDLETGGKIAEAEDGTSSFNIKKLTSGGFAYMCPTDPSFYLWSGQPGEHPRKCLGWHTYPVDGICEASEQSVVAWYVFEDRGLHLFDSRTGQHVDSIEGHAGKVNGVLPLAGNRLLSWSNDGTMRLWNSALPTIRKSYLTVPARVDELCFPTDSVVVTRRYDGCQVLARRTGRVLRDLPDGYLGTGSVDCLSGFSRRKPALPGNFAWHGSGLECRFQKGKVTLWDLETSVPLACLLGADDDVHGVEVSGDGLVIAWSRSNVAYAWRVDLADRKRVVLDFVATSAYTEGMERVRQQHTQEKTSLHGVWQEVWARASSGEDRRSSWFKARPSSQGGGTAPGEEPAVCYSWLSQMDGSKAGLPWRYLGRNGEVGSVPHSWQEFWGLGSHWAQTWQGVRGGSILSGSRVILWSDDGSLRFWCPDHESSGVAIPAHQGRVGGAFELFPGLIGSWSKDDSVLRFTEFDTRAHRFSFKVLSPNVEDVQPLPGGRVLCWTGREYSEGEFPRNFDLLQLNRSSGRLVRLGSTTGSVTRFPAILGPEGTRSISGIMARKDGFVAASGGNTVALFQLDAATQPLATWVSDAPFDVWDLDADGSIVGIEALGRAVTLELRKGPLAVTLPASRPPDVRTTAEKTRMPPVAAEVLEDLADCRQCLLDQVRKGIDDLGVLDAFGLDVLRQDEQDELLDVAARDVLWGLMDRALSAVPPEEAIRLQRAVAHDCGVNAIDRLLALAGIDLTNVLIGGLIEPVAKVFAPSEFAMRLSRLTSKTANDATKAYLTATLESADINSLDEAVVGILLDLARGAAANEAEYALRRSLVKRQWTNLSATRRREELERCLEIVPEALHRERFNMVVGLARLEILAGERRIARKRLDDIRQDVLAQGDDNLRREFILVWEEAGSVIGRLGSMFRKRNGN